ncbi:hypothetical protein [Sporosarcina sp. SAFN-015]|uniref:hypothetical protein n=1 Tax=Sporosarcina sp. SAFN-015 TaxID=3387274 RepID=UPI003F7FF822
MTTEITYTFGINVERAEELTDIAPHVRDFITTIGAGSCDIQVAINPGLGDTHPTQQLAPAIGFVTDSAQYYEDETEEIGHDDEE